jgi:hypothetical protein
MCLFAIDLDFTACAASSVHLNIPTAQASSYGFGGLKFVISDTLGSIIKVPPNTPPVSTEVSFQDLLCSPEDAQKITRLISVMGENGKLSLLLKYQKELRQIGRDIDHVHPLKFITVIMSNPYLKTCLKQIRTDYFKWTNFLDGLGNGLSAQHQQGKVSIYLDDFAKAVNVAPESLQKYIQNHDWENMLIYLMNT